MILLTKAAGNKTAKKTKKTAIFGGLFLCLYVTISLQIKAQISQINAQKRHIYSTTLIAYKKRLHIVREERCAVYVWLRKSSFVAREVLSVVFLMLCLVETMCDGVDDRADRLTISVS